MQYIFLISLIMATMVKKKEETQRFDNSCNFFFTDEILANGPSLSSGPHLSDPVPPTGPGYASAASMGASPNRRAYDMFGHAEPDRGANPCPYGWFGFKDSCYLLSSDEKPWVNAAVSRT